MKSSSTTCPVCLHADFENLFHLERPELGGMSWVCRCTHCGYHAVFPRPTPEFLEAFYGENYGCYGPQSAPVGRALERRLQRLLRYSDRPGRLLDIGGGTGTFVSAALKLGWDAYSLESSDYAHQKASKLLGARAFTGSIEHLDPSLGCFDVMTAWAVVEHLPDPIPILSAAISRLRPGGILYVQCPHIGSLAARIYKNNWRLIKYSPDHVGFFTRKTIQFICGEMGLKLISFRQSGVPFPFGRLGERSSKSRIVDAAPQVLHSASSVFKYDVAGRIAHWVSDRFRLGDNIEFILQKYSG